MGDALDEFDLNEQDNLCRTTTNELTECPNKCRVSVFSVSMEQTAIQKQMKMLTNRQESRKAISLKKGPLKFALVNMVERLYRLHRDDPLFAEEPEWERSYIEEHLFYTLSTRMTRRVRSQHDHAGHGHGCRTLVQAHV